MDSTVRFLFVKNKKRWAFGSWILMQVEEIDYSHCAIEIDGRVFESVWPKSRSVSLSKWLKKYEVVESKTIKLNEFDAQLLNIDIQTNFMNVRYSVFQLLVIGLGFAFEGLDAWAQNIHWNGSKYLICTELVANVANRYFDVDFNEKLDTISLREAWGGIEKIDGGI